MIICIISQQRRRGGGEVWWCSESEEGCLPRVATPAPAVSQLVLRRDFGYIRLFENRNLVLKKKWKRATERKREREGEKGGEEINAISETRAQQ